MAGLEDDIPGESILGTRPSDKLHSTAAKRLLPHRFSTSNTEAFDRYLAFTFSLYVYYRELGQERYNYVVFSVNEDLETMRHDLRAIFHEEKLPVIFLGKSKRAPGTKLINLRLTKSYIPSAFRAVHRNPGTFELRLDFPQEVKAEASTHQSGERVG